MIDCAIQFERVPPELVELERWVIWRGEQRGGDPKTTKVPHQVRRPQERASSTNPYTWSSFEEAVTVYCDGQGDGIGFVLTEQDGFVGIDLDGVLDGEGQLRRDALRGEAGLWIAALNSYTEISPSGSGLHVLGRGRIPAWAGNRVGPVEVYANARFFTITGDDFRGLGQLRPLRELDGFLEAAGLRKDESRTNGKSLPSVPIDLSDVELIEKAKSARNGDAFARLWAGDSTGYSSASEADLSLASKLAFWCGRDPERMDRLLRASGLYRAKWEREDYRTRTLETAIAGCHDTYQPTSSITAGGTTSNRWGVSVGLSTTDPPRLAELFAAVRCYLDIDQDEEPFILGTLAGAVSKQLTDEDPLWLMNVGPPGGGKTEAIRLLDLVADRRVDELTRAGLLSWAPGKRARRVGLLTRIPANALVTVSDFSTVITASDREGRARMFGMLRVVYDGHVYRGIGGEPASEGDELEWSGHLTMIAAATPVIDTSIAYEGALGERWLTLRLPESDAGRAVERARFVVGRREIPVHRERAQQLARELILEARRRVPRELSGEIVERLVNLSVFVAHARTGVQHEGNGAYRVILGIPTPEEPTRLVGQLTRFARCALALGLTPEAALELTVTVALDSVPLARMRALQAVADAGEKGATVSDVHRALIRGNRWAAIWELDALEAIGLVDVEGTSREEDRNAVRIYTLKPEYRRVYENVASYPPSPPYIEVRREGGGG